MGLAQLIDACKDAGVQHLWPLSDPSGSTALDLLGSADGTYDGQQVNPTLDISANQETGPRIR